MTWQVRYSPERAVVESEFTGIISPPELSAAVRAAIALARDHDAMQFLCDCTDLHGGHSVFDLFTLAESLHALGLPPGGREALIMPTAQHACFDAEFWETVCRNRGFEVRGFTARDAALEWLLNASQPLEHA